MARRHGGGIRIGRATHLFPGFHYGVVRPIRDDLRRSVLRAPRRGRAQSARRRRADTRKLTKQLLKDTHKGNPRQATNKSTGKPVSRPPQTMMARQPGISQVQKLRSNPTGSPNISKNLGVKIHKPRALSPHAPRAYHIFPAQRIYHHFRNNP